MSERLVVQNMNLLKLQRYQTSNHDALTRLGLPTWESAKLKGTLYDHNTPIDEFLSFYAAQYDSTEYHASFTDVPSERRVLLLKEVVEKVNPSFQFCPLIPRRVSHEFSLGENKFDLEEFILSMKALGSHLGPCILRLPETFGPSAVRQLHSFFKMWPEELRLAIHFTSDEWIRKPEQLKNIAKMLEGTKKSILIEDRIEAPVDPGKLLTSDHLIVRFFGRPSLGQDEQRLAMWVYRLGEYKGYGVNFSHFHLHEQEEMTLSILKKMANSMGGNVRVPESFDINSKQLGFSF